MSLYLNFYTVPLYITTLLSLVLGFIAWQRRDVPGARFVSVLMAAIVIWSVGYTLELLAADQAAKLFWAKVQYFGIVTTPVAFVFFIFIYLGVDDKIHWPIVVLNSIVPLITLAAAWTNEQHRLLWTAWTAGRNGYPGLDFSHGSVFYLQIAYSYGALLVGSYYIFNALRSSNFFQRQQARILLAGALFPWLGNALYILDLTPAPGLDLTPIAFGVTGALVTYGLLQYRFLDVLPIARNRVIETLTDPMIVLDGRDRIIDINQAAQHQLGLALSTNLLARDAKDILPIWPQIAEHLTYALPVDHPAADMLQQVASETRGNIRIETHHPLDERIYDASITPIMGNMGKLMGRVIMLHDTTQHERDAEALRHSEARLRQIVLQLKDLDEMKTRFIRSINHELRTPLTNISLYISLLKTKPENSERYLSVIEREAATLQRLIEQTLDLARIDQVQSRQPITMKLVDVGELLTGLLPTLQRQASAKKLTVQIKPIYDARYVMGDAERLRQAIEDIAINAINFSSDGEVTLSVEASRDEVRLLVEDTGIGIGAEELPHIFERFYRGEQAIAGNIPGLGLGLSLAKQTIELHGGTITVKSKVGEGSTFTVRLPLLSSEQLPPIATGKTLPADKQSLNEKPRAAGHFVMDDQPVKFAQIS